METRDLEQALAGVKTYLMRLFPAEVRVRDLYQHLFYNQFLPSPAFSAVFIQFREVGRAGHPSTACINQQNAPQVGVTQ